MSKPSIREQIKQAFKDAKNPSFKKIAFGSFGWISRLNSLEKEVLGLVEAREQKLQELADLKPKYGKNALEVYKALLKPLSGDEQFILETLVFFEKFAELTEQ